MFPVGFFFLLKFRITAKGYYIKKKKMHKNHLIGNCVFLHIFCYNVGILVLEIKTLSSEGHKGLTKFRFIQKVPLTLRVSTTQGHNIIIFTGQFHRSQVNFIFRCRPINKCQIKKE
uniref:Uncharacterized protein n=1 Tax=Cacopsylla melanoneura TaxID=428564 RepID=A0A8D8SXM3_9HEMI